MNQSLAESSRAFKLTVRGTAKRKDGLSNAFGAAVLILRDAVEPPTDYNSHTLVSLWFWRLMVGRGLLGGT